MKLWKDEIFDDLIFEGITLQDWMPIKIPEECLKAKPFSLFCNKTQWVSKGYVTILESWTSGSVTQITRLIIFTTNWQRK